MRDNGPTPVKVGLTTNGVINYQIPIGSTAVVYTDAISLCDLNDFALSYKVSCTGTPNVKIELEQSFQTPTNATGADTYYAVPETLAPIESSLTNKNIHHRQLSPVTVEFYRFKLTEQTGLVADTTIQLWLSVQRKWSAG
jgi:hypothetical protein